MNFQVTVLKILVSYRDGFAVMEDLKRGMAILATSGRDWADRTKRLAAQVPDLDIFSHGLVERISSGWQITAKGRAVLEFMEARPWPEPIQTPLLEEASAAIVAAPQVTPLRQPADRAKRRRERRERRREARERASVNASRNVLQSRQGTRRGRREPNPRAIASRDRSADPDHAYLNGRPVSADESTCRFRPGWKRSMRTQGVLRPVSSMIASGPSSMSVPSGIRSRSRPAVVMFSPARLH